MQKFQDSLAKILQVSVVTLDKNGKVMANFNQHSSVFSLFRQHFKLEEDYSKFFTEIATLNWQPHEVKILKDPLSLSVAAVCLNAEVFIVLVGYLDREPQSQGEFLARLQSYGVANQREILRDITTLELPKIKSQALQVCSLYDLLAQQYEEEDKEGQNIVMLMVLEQINKLMFSLLNTENFQLKSLLDLIASSLIILLNAEGAWIFTYHLPQGAVSVYRGAVWGEMISDVEEQWEGAVKRGSNFREVQEFVAGARGFNLETVLLDREKVKIFLGVVNPETNKAQEVLTAFSRQVATVLDIATVYQALQQRLRSLLNSLQQGIVVTDCAGKVMLINQTASRMLGVEEPFRCLGGCIREWGLGAELAELVRAMEMAILTGKKFSQDEASWGAGENCLYMKSDVVPLLGDDATILGAILLFKDVTREVNLRRQLQESERLAIAGEVAASLAHEIRNPLTVALGSLQFFSMVDNPGKQQELLEMTRNELKRMNHILTNFLNLSKPSQSLATEEIDSEKEIRELISLIKSEAVINDIDLEFLPCPEKLPTTRGSKNDLKQVCLNVAKNAIEAMEPGGKLSISLHKREGRIWITFRDNGPGISQENLQNIFRPFFTTKLTGTGLGLYICHNIIKDMGGELRYESQLGQGTSAHIILPPSPDH